MGKAPPGAGDRTLQVQEDSRAGERSCRKKDSKLPAGRSSGGRRCEQRITAVVPEKRPGFSVSRNRMVGNSDRSA